MCIAQGTLFPMCGMNLAFDRKLIGPAMYFGLMGQGQPWGRYDDMWAGWCCKVPLPAAPSGSSPGLPAHSAAWRLLWRPTQEDSCCVSALPDSRSHGFGQPVAFLVIRHCLSLSLRLTSCASLDR